MIVRRVLLYLMLVMAYNLNAQEYLVETTYPFPAQKTIVRDHVYPATISYVKTSEGRCFSYADASMTVSQVWIDDNVEVNDFYVKDEYVFFCGSYNTTFSEGCVGWFKINDFFQSGSSYYLYHSFNWGADNVKLFSHLKPFTDTSTVLVGETASGRAFVMEIIGFIGSPVNWIYNIGVSTEPTEVINQVCVTDNYVVTTGTAFSFALETIRILDRNNLFVALGPYHAIHYYSSYGTGTWTETIGASSSLTHISGDLFAVAEKEKTIVPSYSTSVYGVKVQVFDTLQTLLNPYSATPVHSLFIYVGPGCSAYYNIMELCFCKPAGSLALLTKDFQLLGQSEIIEIPLPPPVGMVDYYRLPNRTMWSITPYNSGADYVCEGFDDAVSTDVGCYTKPVGYNGVICANGNTAIYRTFDYKCKRDKIDLNIYNGKFDFYDEMPEYQEVHPNKIICH